MSLLCKVFDSCLRFNTLSKCLPYSVAFRKENLKYSNWELCMLLKLCSKEKFLFFVRDKNKGKLPTKTEPWGLSGDGLCMKETCIESIYMLLYNKEMGLAQSPVLWDPEEHRVSMLAISQGVKLLFKFKLSHKWKEVQQVQLDFVRDSQSWHKQLCDWQCTSELQCCSPMGILSVKAGLKLWLKTSGLSFQAESSAAWNSLPCTLNTIWEIGLRIQFAKKSKTKTHCAYKCLVLLSVVLN